MVGDEVRDRPAHLAATGACLGKLGRDLLGHVARPAFGGVEGYDPNWLLSLPLTQILDQLRPIGIRFVGLAPDPAENAKMVQHEIDVAVGIFGHDRRGMGHHATLQR